VPGKSLTIEQILSLLAGIAVLTAGLTPAQVKTSPNHDEWSANDLLAHLRACADVWGGCFLMMIAEDILTIRAVNPTTWIMKTDDPELEFRPSFRSFVTQRAELPAILEPLPHEDWLRAATVTGAGAVLERTVLFYAQWLACHERQHVKQVEHIVSNVP